MPLLFQAPALAAASLMAACCSGMSVQPDPATLRRWSRPQEASPQPGAAGEAAAAPMSLQRGKVESSGAALEEMSALADSQSSASYAEMTAMAAMSDSLEAKMRTQVAECNKQKKAGKVGPDGWKVPEGPEGSTSPGVFLKPWNKHMNTLRDSEAWGTKPVKYPPPPKGSAVHIALLMFADDHVDNEDIWLKWMEQGKIDGLAFSMYIHAYGVPPRGVSQWKSQRFRQYLVPDQARTVWCQMFDAQMLMLSRALMDSRHTHFMMLSSDSVPVKPMRWMYNRTREEPYSRFCADDYWRDPWPRAETWTMLRRGDAMFYQENRGYVERHLRKDCEEEFAWYFPLRARWDNFPESGKIKKECIMFSNWKDGEQNCKEEWASNADACNCPTLRHSNSTAASFKHPATYHDVGADALEELVRSPFWFARKFTEGAVPEELSEVLNIDITKPPASKKKKRFGIFR